MIAQERLRLCVCPYSKTVVLGLIISKRPQLEMCVLMRRIQDAARYVPWNILRISRNCGFCYPTMKGNLLTEGSQKQSGPSG